MTTVEIETEHDDAEAVARAVAPDNTDEMDTRIEGERVVTRIEREDVGSAGSTGDDYLRSLIVADELLDAL
jgi:tRNA threonylcarbamoyladenosine modification (KEOPS) complex  Pcc1 subunit